MPASGREGGLSVTVEQFEAGRAVIVAGGGDEELLSAAARSIAAAMIGDDVRVVNLDQLFLADANATRAFLAHLLDAPLPARVALCCERLSGRRLLRRWGGDDLPIFVTAADAVRYAYPAPAAARP